MGLGFPTNLLTSGNLKTDLSKAKDEELESKSLKKTTSFFLEIAQTVLVEVFCSVFIFW